MAHSDPRPGELAERLQRALGDGYRVGRELGGGGMSRVFRVDDLELEREIVVKVLPPDLAAGLSVERFKREIHLAARLQHPHIVPLLTAGAKDGLLYYAMPYIAGESLRVRLARQHELPIAESVRILRDVVDALCHAHGQGVLHRDIKPDNVLVAGHHALVTDFGVARALATATGQTSITSVGVALGTPAYMSPEQASADPGIDHRSDIYSVGALAYELLTGRPPFAGLSPHQVLAAHVTTHPEPVTTHRESVSPALSAVVMRCLEKRPSDRWQTADELLAHLEALATPSGGLTPTAAVAAVRGGRRRTSGLLVAGVTALLVVGAGGWWLLRAEAPLAVVSTTQVTKAAGLELDAAISPDGKFVAYAAGPPGRTRIHVRQIAGGAARALSDSGPEGQRTPRWSPDGERITFIAGAALYESAAFGGRARQLVDGGDYEFASPSLSPDGKTVAFARHDGVYLRAVNGSDATRVAAARLPSHVSWSPDGRRLAYVSDNPWFVHSTAMLGNIAPSTIFVADVERREAIAVTDSVHLNAAPAWHPDGRGLLFVSSRGGNRDIYHLPLGRDGRPRGEPVRLTTGANAHTLSLSSDGTRLAYTVLSAHSNVWWAPVGGNAPTPASAARAVTNENQTVEGLALSPDGRWIAFDSNREGHQQIFKVPLAGGEPLQLTREPADCFNPTWSGDGRWIAFHSLRAGSRDLYVMDADGNDVRRVTDARGHEMGAAASRDGRALLYISDHAGAWELFAVTRTADGGWGPPRQVTRNLGYRGRWAPDGRRIVYLSLRDTTLHLADADGSNDRVLFDGHALGLTPQTAAFGRDPDVVYFTATDVGGRHGFYAIPTRGGPPRPVLLFDDPARQPRRPEFDTDGERLVFTLATDESDVWVMELRR